MPKAPSLRPKSMTERRSFSNENHKKQASLLLTLSLACSLIACGESKRSDPSDTANGELQFALGTPLTKEFEYTDDDGVVLLTEKYELPQLE